MSLVTNTVLNVQTTVNNNNNMASYLETADPAVTENSPAFDRRLHSFNTVQTKTKITF